jgi:hypothetical protein
MNWLQRQWKIMRDSTLNAQFSHLQRSMTYQLNQVEEKTVEQQAGFLGQ